jgi:hypothetical protein
MPLRLLISLILLLFRVGEINQARFKLFHTPMLPVPAHFIGSY